MKKKKVYCKKCRWRDCEVSCRIWQRVDDYDSPKHKILLHEFSTATQNRNNDCPWYQFSFWSLIP